MPTPLPRRRKWPRARPHFNVTFFMSCVVAVVLALVALLVYVIGRPHGLSGW